MKRGRPRKAGPRNAKGRLIIVHDKGTEHAQAMQALYGQDGCDAIGRAYHAGLLGEGSEAKALLALRRTRLQPIPAERHLPAPAPWHPTRDELDELKAALAGKLKASR